ncbi:MAG: DNA mismatch repair protein MutS, partial [Nitrospirae bacterium]|nr:DNA mismatch repair protein MutS [Nitrospirota bacterium]
MANQEQLTPLLRQYQNIKREHKDAILFFRMGDFYEMFYDDAIAASKILEIALTTRDKRTDDPVPMCGIPYHAINSYLPKLIREGRKVAICEQVEDPAQAKGIVRREVIRVITPGTVLDGSLLESKENNFIAAIYPDTGPAGLAFVDVSTGDFFIAEMEISGIKDEMARIEPREVLFPQGSDTSSLLSNMGQHLPFINPYPSEVFEYESATRIFHEHIGKDTAELSKINLKGPAINAAGALLHYLSETQKTSL